MDQVYIIYSCGFGITIILPEIYSTKEKAETALREKGLTHVDVYRTPVNEYEDIWVNDGLTNSESPNYGLKEGIYIQWYKISCEKVI